MFDHLLYPISIEVVYEAIYLYHHEFAYVNFKLESCHYARLIYRDAMLGTGLQNYAENVWYRRG